MEKQENKGCTCCIVLDAPGYISPYEQDMLLTDLTDEYQKGYLMSLKWDDEDSLDDQEPSIHFPSTFPVKGRIRGLNKRLLVQLVCKDRDSDSLPVKLLFLINTASPCSYLSETAMKALIGDPSKKVNKFMYVYIQSETLVTEVYLSPPDKHFSNVNVLGMDFLSKHSLSLDMNFSESTFELKKSL